MKPLKKKTIILLCMLCCSTFFSACTIKFEAEKIKMDAEPVISQTYIAIPVDSEYVLTHINEIQIANSP